MSMISPIVEQFPPSMVLFGEALVKPAMQVYKAMSSLFPATATKFHYQFNLRDVVSLIHGLCHATMRNTPTNLDLSRLFLHELWRVFGDKLADAADLKVFDDLLRKQSRRGVLDDINQDKLHAQPNIYMPMAVANRERGETSSVSTSGNASNQQHMYRSVTSFEQLRQILQDALQSHNETNAAMNLVLFNDAMAHVVRISRMLLSPRGHGLLVGVGGNGKQSLAKLAAYIAGFESCSITLRPNYGLSDFKVLVLHWYVAAIPSLFLFSFV